MARSRTPLAKAKITGAASKHPERFADRKEPKSKPIGDPSHHMSEYESAAWEAFKKEIPWLMEADRALLEIACNLRGRLIAGNEVGVQALGQLRMCLAQMGGTPADRSKVNISDDESNDPAEKYFN